MLSTTANNQPRVHRRGVSIALVTLCCGVAIGADTVVAAAVTAPTTTRVSISPSRAQRAQAGSGASGGGQATCSFTPTRDDTDTFGASYSGEALYGGSHGSDNDRHDG
jgi:hypothetical protein